MTVGETLKSIVEERKDDYIRAGAQGGNYEQVEHYERLFIAAVHAYAVWIAE